MELTRCTSTAAKQGRTITEVKSIHSLETTTQTDIQVEIGNTGINRDPSATDVWSLATFNGNAELAWTTLSV